MKLSLHPGAQNDIDEAAAFYAQQGSPAVAARFKAELKRLTALLLEQPHIGSPRAYGFRGFSMSAFPFTILYRVHADEVEIVVVKHDRKRPGFGSSRS